jgi:thiol-disulfide isomerase/thioredoxin
MKSNIKRGGALLLLLALSLAARAGEVRLHGTAREWKNTRVELRYAGSSSEIGDHRSVHIPVDSVGHFDITLLLAHPAYYTTGMHTLYLSPGDNIEIALARAISPTTFAGKGSEANTYLKGVRWHESRQLGLLNTEAPPLERLLAKVDSLAGARTSELTSLKNVSRRFREIEKARITANKISVHFNYIYRTEFYRWDDPPEVKQEKKIAYHQSIKPAIAPLLHRIDHHASLLECPDIREILLECYRSGLTRARVPGRLVVLEEAIRESSKMDEGISKSNAEAFRDYARQLKEPDFREAFDAKLARRVKLMEGRPAVDINLRDIHGNPSKLADHEGKVLFIDFWATWCLPCLAQAPRVKELSEKFTRVEFIAISIDQEEARWKSKLEKDGERPSIKNFIADPYELIDAWDLSSIPRFVLIDQDFNIITAFAPRPTEEALIESLLERYNK